MDKKPIFIAEVKTKSPFGYFGKLYWKELFDIAEKHGDWISIHTDYRWGGSFKLLKFVRTLTKKPILAKGIHSTDEEVQKALDCGADYVLVVDRLPAEKYIDKCLLEVSTLNKFREFLRQYPNAKYVYNQRDLNTGEMKDWNYFDAYKCEMPQWLCQASGIKSRNNVNRLADAFIVGEHLEQFCKEYMEDEQTFTINVTMKNRWVPHFLSMLKYFQYLGGVGSSRQVTFYADGDGDFRPKFEWDKELDSSAKPAKESNGDRYYDAG